MFMCMFPPIHVRLRCAAASRRHVWLARQGSVLSVDLESAGPVPSLFGPGRVGPVESVRVSRITNVPESPVIVYVYVYDNRMIIV